MIRTGKPIEGENRNEIAKLEDDVLRMLTQVMLGRCVCEYKIR
jgi:hypothetical protein